MHYIGIAGQCFNGKDSLADYLQVRLNDRQGHTFWQRSAFAAAVKRIYCETFDKDLAFVEAWKVRPEPPPGMDMSVRKALQFIGDGFRAIKGSIWIDLMFRDRNVSRIISDGRYVNELQAVRDHDGYNILVVHPDRVNDDRNGSEAQMRPFACYALRDHPPYRDSVKPAGWDLVHSVVINDGDLGDLFRRADALVPTIEEFFANTERASA